MRVYQNITTERRSFRSLQSELVDAIREYAQERELGDIENDILACCETLAVKEKTGLLQKLSAKFTGGGTAPSHRVGMLVTPEWLIWAVSGEKAGTTVLAARLEDIEIRDIQEEWKDTRFAVEDTGISVFGFIGRSSEKVNAFVPVGAGAAGDDLRATLKEAMAQAKRA